MVRRQQLFWKHSANWPGKCREPGPSASRQARSRTGRDTQASPQYYFLNTPPPGTLGYRSRRHFSSYVGFLPFLKEDPWLGARAKQYVWDLRKCQTASSLGKYLILMIPSSPTWMPGPHIWEPFFCLPPPGCHTFKVLICQYPLTLFSSLAIFHSKWSSTGLKENAVSCTSPIGKGLGYYCEGV